AATATAEGDRADAARRRRCSRERLARARLRAPAPVLRGASPSHRLGAARPGARDNPRVTDAPSIRSRLARRFDPVELRAIKRLWVRHSIAEDARDIDGLVATLAQNCAYEMVPTGQRWE